MLALAFHVGKDRFALRCADVVEVVPRVELRDIPHAPAHIAGMFTYRGTVVPVIDLCQLLWKRPCADRMSSRIILVRHPQSGSKVIGLMAEKVTEAVRLDPDRAAPPGIEIRDAPYLGEVHFDEQSMIQLLRVDLILQGVPRAVLLDEGAG